MTFPSTSSALRRTTLAALLALAACATKSQSLGDDPQDTEGFGTETGGPATESEGSTGAPDDSPPEVSIAFDTRLTDVVLQFLSVAEDGSFAAAGLGDYGGQAGDGAFFFSSWVGVFEADGAPRWEYRAFGGDPQTQQNDFPAPSSVTVGADGSVFATYIDYSDFPISDNAVHKYASDGTPIWETLLEHRPSAVAATSDGGAIVAGLAGDDDVPNVVYGWAARIDSLGAVVADRVWTNEQGRGTRLLSATIDGDGRAVLGGSWGVDPASSAAEAWAIWVDDDLQSMAELRLPHSGGTDWIDRLETRPDGTVVGRVSGIGLGATLITISSDGTVVDSLPPPEGTTLRSAYPQGGGLTVEFTAPCGDEEFLCGDGSTLGRVEPDGRISWEATIDGCVAIDARALPNGGAAIAGSCVGADFEGMLVVLAPPQR